MRGSFLPRRMAAGIIVSAVVRAGWASAAVNLLLAASALYLASSAADGGLNLTIPFLAIAAMLTALGFLIWLPSNITSLLYLLVGAVSVYAYQLALLEQQPLFQQGDAYLLNRPAMALVLVGTTSIRPLPAVAWGVGGFVAGQLAMVVATMQLALPAALSSGPPIILGVYCAAYLVLAAIVRAQKGSLPALYEGEPVDPGADVGAMHRTSAAVQETVLNNLAYVINGPAELDSHARMRLRADAESLTSGEWEFDASQLHDPTDASFRNRLLRMISDVQWRGLTVNVSGNPNEVLPLNESAAGAALDAARGCLENVLKHSATSAAELILGHAGEAVTIMIIDSGGELGTAHDGSKRGRVRPAALRAVERSGGSVRVWSVPGQGTCVLISVPAMGSVPATAAAADA